MLIMAWALSLVGLKVKAESQGEDSGWTILGWKIFAGEIAGR
jgi:hypothetical protein